MKASEIISRIERRAELEKKAIEKHNNRHNMLLDILHIIKQDGYIEKKEKDESKSF